MLISDKHGWICSEVCDIYKNWSQDQFRQICKLKMDPNLLQRIKRSPPNNYKERASLILTQKLLDSFIAEFKVHFMSVIYDNDNKNGAQDIFEIFKLLNKKNISSVFVDASKSNRSIYKQSPGLDVSLSVVLSDTIKVKEYLQHQARQVK